LPVFEQLSIPTLTVVLFIIELFSLIYYLILWKNTESKTALFFTFATMYMIFVNILGFSYSYSSNLALWKIYICLLTFLWPFFAFAVGVFENPGTKIRVYILSATGFFAISILGVAFLKKEIIALQSSAASMVFGLGYAAYILSRLDKKVYSSGRLVGILVFVCYAFIGVMRATAASFDIAWEKHFYISQTTVQSLYFLISVIFASLMPITVYVLHTERSTDALKKNAEQLAKEKLKLQSSFEEIKTLRGIIPICMYCKKIRNDEGFWEDVAVYIQNHTYADMSHGLCPDCLNTLYPDVYDKMKSSGRIKE
jgi:hypothetical protein